MNLMVDPILTPTEGEKVANKAQHIRQKRRKLRGQRCECCACSAHFNKVSTFDSHRVGKFGKNRKCLTTQEMKDKGMNKTQDDYWIAPISEKSKEYFKNRLAH